MNENTDQESIQLTKDVFLKSRNKAVLRCAEIMVDSGRKDLAKNILASAHIDRNRLMELKSESMNPQDVK
jgi:hypothetical protein